MTSGDMLSKHSIGRNLTIAAFIDSKAKVRPNTVQTKDDGTGDGVCINFRASKPVSLYHRVFWGLEGEYRAETLFSAEAFAESLLKIGVTPDEERQYFGYSVSSDITMLK